jgi:adenylate cyclase
LAAARLARSGALTLAVPHPIITRRTWLWQAETGAVIEALGFAGDPLTEAGRATGWLGLARCRRTR